MGGEHEERFCFRRDEIVNRKIDVTKKGSAAVFVALLAGFVSFLLLLAIGGADSPLLLIFLLLTIVIPVSVLVGGAIREGALDVLSPFALVPLTLGIIYGGSPEYLREQRLFDQAIQVELALVSGSIAYYVGVIILYLVIPRTKQLPIGAQSFPDRVISGRRIVFVFLFGALAMVLYWRAAGGIPILQGDLENSRLEALAGSGVPFYLSMLMMVAFWVGLSPKSTLSIYSKFALFILGGGLLMTSGWRNTVFAFAVVGLLAIHYVKPIRTGYIALAGFIAVLGASALGLYRVYSSELTHYTTYQKLSDGDFLGAFSAYLESYRDVFGSNLAIVFQVVPDALAFQNGKTLWWNFVSLLPGVEQEPFDFVLKRAAGQGFAGGGLPPTLVGEWYINFSWTGVWLGMFAVGVFVALWHHFLRRTSNYTVVLLAIVSIYYVFVSVRGGVGNVLLTLAWLMISIIVVVWFSTPKAINRDDENTREVLPMSSR